MKKLWLLVLLVTLCFAGTVRAAAPVKNLVDGNTAAAVNASEEDQYPNPVRDMMATYGKITGIDGNKITVSGEGNYPKIVARVGGDTYILNGRTGVRLTREDLKEGQEVTAYYSSRVTKSYPAEAAAYAFVRGPIDDGVGKFFRVASVKPSEDDDQAVVILNSNHDIKATITRSACADYNLIQAGDALLLWYSAMTLSIPAETTADKALLLRR
jgi:uncharacterized protein YdeI (BOF family)